MTPIGFTHSEICGSKGMCPSPQLIAACHVLHRLPVPRHPPCALTIFFLMVWYYTYTQTDFSVWRSDAIFLKKKIRFVTLCSSQGTRGKNPQDRILRARRHDESFSGIDGALCQLKVLSSLEEVILPRKEVIQPHLPVRLPCYDLVLITDPTLDSSLPCGLGHWRWVLPTFMT